MKLLIITQAVDTQDPVLGFFHEWIAELAPRFDSVEVICLRKGLHSLPHNVRVHSLGKERGSQLSIMYALRFLWLAWGLRKNYDRVFVHMNQEYILVAGLLWKLCKKPVYFWRNHYAGSFLTDLACKFCEKVFYTSKSSFTAACANAMQMPVGVDTNRFRPDTASGRTPRSVLFLGRMAPSKRPELLLEALRRLEQDKVLYSATFVGSPLPQDQAYYDALVAHAPPNVSFVPAVSHADTPALYRTHQVFVNTSPSGMLDKTIFEAAASGCIVLAASKDARELFGEACFFEDAAGLAARLRSVLGVQNSALQARIQSAAKEQDLGRLGAILSQTITAPVDSL